MTDLLRRLDQVHPREMPAVVDDVLTALPGVVGTRLLLLDQDGRVLLPFGTASVPPYDSGSSADGLDVESSTPGSAVAASGPVLEPVGASRVDVHLALRERSETLGVLTVTCQGDAPEDAVIVPATLAELSEAALELGYVLAGSGAWSDHVTVARRAHPMTLPAELQWMNLPLQGLRGPGFAAAGKVLPTYEVGGDLFDLSWGPRGPWLTVADALGHGLRSSLLAHAAIGTARHARRCGLDLATQAGMADRTLLQQWDGLNFVTAVLAELDVEAGVLRWVNAGHLPPLLLRDGTVEVLARTPQRPLGLLEETSYVTHELPVRPGDRLVVVSDGMTEAHRKGGSSGPFGHQRLQGAVLAAATLSPADAVRGAVRLVDDWTSGEARDDATMLVVDVLAP